MQNRYTGDIGDFGKLGLLRRLSMSGLSIGVNWYLTPDETHNNDGSHINYLKKSSFSDCDKQLWTVLGQIVDSGKRAVSELDRPDILSASFYSQILDFTGAGKSERQTIRSQWHSHAVQRLRNCDIIFVDPDNGLIVPSQDGKPKSSKYVLPSELADYYNAGASVIYYQHKARLNDEFYIEKNKQLISSGAFPGAESIGLKFISTSQRYYFFLMHPEHSNLISHCIEKMLNSPWKKYFVQI